MTVIGLTGSFGTGKTFVASIFRSFGARVIDADVIAHRVIRKGSPAYKKIVEAFGHSILGPFGHINRGKLASRVFASPSKVAKINSIVHPEVIRIIKASISAVADKDAVVVVDAPLLIEARLLNIVDKLVVVKSSKKRQIERCRKKFQIKQAEVLKRIRSQMSMKRKLKMADFVVKNDSTRSSTRRQVRKVWEEVVWK
ncbi:MAG: dephospho-CoA kinase [Candidatus Omnitrophica bacterium]|nr:dephospho-CoA kinase [Candidatus Omnitrophota bacterium]